MLEKIYYKPMNMIMADIKTEVQKMLVQNMDVNNTCHVDRLYYEILVQEIIMKRMVEDYLVLMNKNYRLKTKNKDLKKRIRKLKAAAIILFLDDSFKKLIRKKEPQEQSDF